MDCSPLGEWSLWLDDEALNAAEASELVSGQVEEEPLLRAEYLATENGIDGGAGP